MDDGTFPALLKTLSDSSEEVRLYQTVPNHEALMKGGL
jgi:hypothetical protein